MSYPCALVHSHRFQHRPQDGRSSVYKECLPRLNHITKNKWEIPLLFLQFFNRDSVVLETQDFGPQPFHGRMGFD